MRNFISLLSELHLETFIKSKHSSFEIQVKKCFVFIYTRLRKFNHTTFYFDSSSVIRQLRHVLTIKIFEKMVFGGARETEKYANLDSLSCGRGKGGDSYFS